MKITLLFLSVFLSASLFGQTFGNGVTDIDGNYYETVIIGDQEWMAANLNTTKFNDGTAIGNITDLNQWSSLTIPNWVYMNNDSQFEIPYGKLYNGHTIMSTSKNICPNGWHVPSNEEFETLTTFLGGINSVGSLKEEGLAHWNSPNTGATNTTGFSAVGNGSTYGMTSPGTFPNFGNAANFHTTNAQNATNTKFVFTLNTNNTIAQTFNSHFNDGAGIRCLKPYSTVGIESIQLNRNLIQILDLMGRETSFKPNTPLIYVYDDGSTEKVFTIE
tara:strand:+ start:849 stop:1670 length:822 start_codon:yes stop_codon:yes gene_type:complete